MRNKSELRGYQQRIIAHLYEHDEAICVARMGGGKTASALTAIRELLDDGVIRHALVIAPKRVARNVWPDEIAQWAHLAGLRYAVLDGNPGQRSELLTHESVAARDITIVGIDLVQWLCDKITGHGPPPLFDLLVIDEVSRLRNPTGKRAQALAKCATQWKMIWGLSGTLRPSGPLDLFMPSRVVTRGKLWGRSFWKWRETHFYPTDYNGYDWAPLPGAEATLNAQIAPLTVVLNDDEMPDMPPLTLVYDDVELPPAARRAYDTMEESLFVRDGEDIILAANAAVAVGKMSQMANGFVYDESTVGRELHTAKREWLEDLVEEMDRPLLLIYEFREDLRMIQDVLGDKVPYLGSGVSDAQSTANINAWNTGRIPYMALHPASGGHGLNLQHGGSDMAWIAPCWSPELWEQTIARLHRPGQVRPVIVRICRAIGTVDNLKILRVRHKMSAQAAFEAYLRDHHRVTA